MSLPTASHPLPRDVTHNLFVRSFTYGPENPAKILAEAGAQLHKYHRWKYVLAEGMAVGFSGSMVLFLILVFIWRRSLVDRVSLRLIFAISVCDLVINSIQLNPPRLTSLAAIQTYTFFSNFFIYSAFYLSSSIAFNLQMVFLRKSNKALPKYVEYLYYIVPFSVVVLQFTPQTIWAGVHGYQTPFVPVMARTTHYIIYITFVYFFIPAIFLSYNIITTTRVIIALVKKQRTINQIIQAMSEEGSARVSGESEPKSRSNSKDMAREKNDLTKAHNVYKAAIRIALYPLTPLVFFAIIVTSYTQQYFITATYQSDVPRIINNVIVTFFMYPSLAMANFLIFLTDPAIVSVIREVGRSIRQRYSKRESMQERRDSQQSQILSISEKQLMVQSDAVSLDSVSVNDENNNVDVPVMSPSFSMIEEGWSCSSSVDTLRNDNVLQHIRRGGDEHSVFNDF